MKTARDIDPIKGAQWIRIHKITRLDRTWMGSSEKKARWWPQTIHQSLRKIIGNGCKMEDNQRLINFSTNK